MTCVLPCLFAHSVVYVAFWSPSIFFLERRVGQYSLTDERRSLYERACTHDGDLKHCASEAVRSRFLLTRFQTAIHGIVKQIQKVESKKQIGRMVLHFKIDPEGDFLAVSCDFIHAHHSCARFLVILVYCEQGGAHSCCCSLLCCPCQVTTLWFVLTIPPRSSGAAVLHLITGDGFISGL